MGIFNKSTDDKVKAFHKKFSKKTPFLDRMVRAAAGMSAKRDEKRIKRALKLLGKLQKKATKLSILIAKPDKRLKDDNLRLQLESDIKKLALYQQKFTSLQVSAMERVAAQAPQQPSTQPPQQPRQGPAPVTN